MHIEVDATSETRAMAADPSTDDNAVRPPRVLLVDDNYLVRACLAAELEELGLSVVCAKSGNEARAILSSQEVDLALIDVVLGDESGRLLASFTASRNVPVVLASGYGEVIDAEREGAFPFLSKPIHLDDIVRVFSAMLPSWSPP
jgi:DNA-binding NtrC family response regulator